MHEQCPAAVPSALSLVMPRSSLPRRRSSMLSSVSDPHTPPPRDAPLPHLFSPASNRKSSDSWNSSNYDGADDLDWEWKPEQTRLLSRVRPRRVSFPISVSFPHLARSASRWGLSTANLT